MRAHPAIDSVLAGLTLPFMQCEHTLPALCRDPLTTTACARCAMMRALLMYSLFVMTEVGLPRNCWIQSMGAAMRPTPQKTRNRNQPVCDSRHRAWVGARLDIRRRRAEAGRGNAKGEGVATCTVGMATYTWPVGKVLHEEA